MLQGTSSTLIAGLISNYLPIKGDIIKLQIGMVLSQLIDKLMASKFTNLFNFFKKKNNELVVKSMYNGIINPIYTKLEEYIINKFIDNIKSLQLVPIKGEINFIINDNNTYKSIWDLYNKHKIKIEIIEDNYNTQDTQNTHNTHNTHNTQKFIKKNIILSSNTATIDDLKKFVIDLYNIKKQYTKILNIYNVCVLKNSNNNLYTWDVIDIKTNKNFENTILSDSVKNELITDLKWFVNNENWFQKKGIPYKRGYLLYGPPGTGKTSIIKAIANTYSMSIFNIDLQTINTDLDLIKLVNDINYYVNNKNYILVCEDIDRIDLFNKSYNSYNSKKTISIECILNILDGIIESYGRILILTANDISNLINIKALLRPGRIDKNILINYCDYDQIIKLIKNFYDIDDIDDNNFNLDNTNISNCLTPAELLKIMQNNIGNVEGVIKEITCNEKKNEIQNNNNLTNSFGIYNIRKNRHKLQSNKFTSIDINKSLTKLNTRKVNVQNNIEKLNKILENKIILENKKKERENIKKEKEVEKNNKKKEKEQIKKEKEKEKEQIKKEKEKEQIKKEKEKEKEQIKSKKKKKKNK